MKKNLSRFIITIGLMIFGLGLNSGRVSAENITDNKLKISPSFKVFEFEGNSPVKDQLKISNSYDEDIAVKFIPVVIKVTSEKIEIIEDSNLRSNIIVRDTPLVIKKKSSGVVNFEIKEPSSFSDNLFPAIKVQPVYNGSGAVAVESALISTLFIENKSNTVSVDLKVVINQITTYGNKVKIKAEIINNGKRIFTPTGEIIVKKGGKRLDAIEMTSQINKLLLPGRSVTFEKEFTISNDDLHLTDKLGKYDITVNVNPSPFTNAISQTTSVSIISNDVIASLALVIAIIIVIIIVLIFGFKKVNKNSKKRRKNN